MMPASPPTVQRYQPGIFLIFTFALFWLTTPLARASYILPGLVAAFAPAIVALILAVTFGGGPGVRALLGKLAIWRVGWRWYLAALGIPVLASLAILLISRIMGNAPVPQFGSLLALLPVIFVLAVGEELGWRGFLLPRLLELLPALAVAIILGMIHAAYHLPLWVAPGFPAPAYSLASFVVASLAFGVIWTWLYRHTQGSVLIATLFHGAINSAGNIFFAGLTPAQLNWPLPVAFGLVALAVILWFGPALVRQPG